MVVRFLLSADLATGFDWHQTADCLFFDWEGGCRYSANRFLPCTQISYSTCSSTVNQVLFLLFRARFGVVAQIGNALSWTLPDCPIGRNAAFL